MQVSDYYKDLQTQVDEILNYPPAAIVSIRGRKVYVCDSCGHLRFLDDGLHVHSYQMTVGCFDQN